MLENHQVITKEKVNNRFVRIKQVMHMTGISRAHIYHLASKGLFPQSVSIVSGGSSVGWVEAEVQGWIEQRIADRDQELPHA